MFCRVCEAPWDFDFRLKETSHAATEILGKNVAAQKLKIRVSKCRKVRALFAMLKQY